MGRPSPATTDSATSRRPPPATRWPHRLTSAQIPMPVEAFSTLQPVTTVPSAASAAAPTRTLEYGA